MATKKTGALAAGIVLGAGAMLAIPAHADEDHTKVPYGVTVTHVTQTTSVFAAPYCIVSQRDRLVYHQLNGATKVHRGPWSAWKIIDEGRPAHATDGTICAVQH